MKAVVIVVTLVALNVVASIDVASSTADVGGIVVTATAVAVGVCGCRSCVC